MRRDDRDTMRSSHHRGDTRIDGGGIPGISVELQASSVNIVEFPIFSCFIRCYFDWVSVLCESYI